MSDFFEWTGATSDLEALAEELGELATRQFMAKLVDEISKEAVRRIKKQFEKGVDPYGKPWIPLKVAKGPRTGGPLRKTDSMMNSIKRSLSRDGFKIVSNDPKIQFHNGGTKTIPVRLIFPKLTGNIPPGDISIEDDLTPFHRLMQSALAAALKKFDLDVYGESNDAVDEVDFSGGGFSFRKGT